MRRLRNILLFFLILLAMGTSPVWAQRTSSASALILANNRGIFDCTVNTAIFNFGNVDADGTDFGTPNVIANGRNGTNTGGSYETAPGAITWRCRAAPPSAVDLALNSTVTDHLGGVPDHLEARIPPTAGGTSAGYQAFTSQADLITGMSVANAAGAATGDLDLLLSVLDADPIGSNLWIVRLRASGTP